MGALGALALWVEGNVIVASGTDHSLPRILSLAKPKKVGTGVLGPYSVRASDAWSPMVDVLWRYGDGTTERGISVRHAYARARQLSRHGARQRRRRQHRAAHVRGRVAPIARAVSARATANGLSVAIACLPSSPSVTGTVTAAIPAPSPCRSAAACRGAASALVPGKVARGQARSSCA